MQGEYKNLKILKRTQTEKSGEVICGLNLTADGSVTVLSADARIGETFADIESGGIVYGGIATANCIYSGDGPDLREAATKFSFRLPTEETAENATVSYRVTGAEVREEGGMLSIAVSFTAVITYFVATEEKALVGIDALTKKENATFDEAIFARGKTEAEDEFEAKKIKKILASSARSYVTGAQCGQGVIIVDGSVVVGLVVLLGGEHGEIERITRIIPFRYELDCEGADVSMSCYALTVADKVSARAEVDEERDKSSVSLVVEVSVTGGAYITENFEYVADAYSPDCDISIERKEVKKEVFTGFYTGSERVGGKAECLVPEYSRFIAVSGERTELSDVSYGAEIKAEGVIRGDALFIDGENELKSVPFALPFAFDIPFEGKAYGFTVETEDISCRLRNGRLEVDGTLKTCYYTIDEIIFPIIVSAEAGEAREAKSGVISIYVGEEGDTEWDAVKALGEDAEKLKELNPSLSFPLVGGEKIISYKE